MNNQMKMLEVLWTFILIETGFYLYLDFDSVMNLYYIFNTESYLFIMTMFIYIIVLLILSTEIIVTIVSLFQNKTTTTIQNMKFNITKKMVMAIGSYFLIWLIYVEYNLNLNKEITKTQYKNLVETLKVNKDGRQIAKEIFNNSDKIIYSKYINFWKKLNKIEHNKYMKEKSNEGKDLKEEMKKILNKN